MGHQYTKEEKLKAIELYQKLGHVSWVIHALGYPSRTLMYVWLDKYKSGELENSTKKKKYSDEQRKAAVEYYLNNGRSIKKTVTALGYPGKTLLGEWLNEDLTKEQRNWSCMFNGRKVKYSKEQKAKVVVKYCSGQRPTDLSKEYNIGPSTITKWKKELLGQENTGKMSQKESGKSKKTENYTIDELKNKKEELEAKVQDLENEIYDLQLKKDILEKASEIIKKDQGINLKNLSNKEKTTLIDALRKKYRLNILLRELKLSKSSYFYQASSDRQIDKYKSIRKRIIEIFNENYCSYGYRRIYGILMRENIHISEKVIRRIMQEEGLSVYKSKKRKYCSYKGEISPEVPNLLNRNFHAKQLNQKWLTDITEFHIPAGKIYLSPIIDCFDGSAVSWTIGTTPNADLVNSMLDEAIAKLPENTFPVIHSDRGCHYRWPGWIEKMNSAGLTRSMSKKGCSPDNSACEGFFGRLKNEMFYGKSWIGVSINEFTEELNKYIKWYNEKRIKQSLGYLSPLEYRNKLAKHNQSTTLDNV